MKKKRHILFLCSWYPSKVCPTNGDFIQRHAEAISTSHQVSVLHIITDKKATKSTIDIKTIHNVHTHIGYIAPTSNPILKWIRYIHMYMRLLQFIGNFDLVHLQVTFPFGLFALFLKRIQKKPFIISEHWTGYLSSKQHQTSLLHKIIAKRIIRKAAYVCPVSIELMTAMQEFGFAGTYTPISNVVDTGTFNKKKDKEHKFTIIHISSLNDEQKNISGMLRAAKKLEDKIGPFTWKFIGGTSKNYLDLIEKLAFKHAIIEYIDHLSQEALAVHLQQAHICVSFSNYETFGITVVEAIASGTSVIATPTGIVHEIAKEAQITTIPIGDEAALVQAIMHIKSEALTPDSKAMHLYIKKHFGSAAIAQQFSKVYDNVLHNRS